MDIQSLFPVYLSKTRTEDQSKEDYETQITQNENVLNQNLNILFNGLRDLADTVDHIEVGGSSETIVQTVVQPSTGGGGDYTLPPATANTLGGIIVGGNLNVTSKGVLSVATTDEVAEDNNKPITSAAVYATIGNINALLSKI